jgi:phosphinothricin acetyltransferase
VVEVTVYVDENCWNNGVGTSLLEKLILEAPNNGFWCLYSSIYSTNEKSIKLHNKCGFRTIGYRERIAKDRFGNWTDTTLMEYRFPDELVKEI